MNGIKVSVIIPCYNEQEVIDITYQRTKSVISPTDEIVFVNDGNKYVSQADSNDKANQNIGQVSYILNVINLGR